MGVGSRRPPLPAPTDISSADNTSAVGISDDLATNISTRTDKTHYTIPEDGSPVTITTKRPKDSKKHSSTSLLIEYFEGNQSGDKPTSRPSLRVRVTPSGSRKTKKHGRDHIQISETRKSGKPSAVRRISIPSGSSESIDVSSGSELSATRPPMEVEVFHNHSELSELHERSDPRSLILGSEISSMPPDSMLDGPTPNLYSPKRRRSATTVEKENTRDTLKAPTRSRSRSASKERLTQRVMEKLSKDPGVRIRETSTTRRKASGSSDRSRSRSVSHEILLDEARSPKGKASKHLDDSSLHPSEISTVSSRSNASINNPKLLSALEDTIKKLILPEINAIKEEQKTMKNRHKFDEISRSSRPSSSRSGEEVRRVSKSSSLPSVGGKRPDIVADDRGVIHSERRRTSRKSSRESASEKSVDTAVRDSHGRRRSSGERKHSKESLGVYGAAALVGLAGGAEALRHKSSSYSVEKERRKRRSKSRSRSRATSVSDHAETSRRDHADHADPSSVVTTEERERERIPPLPMQSYLESELTRDSILSAETDHTERPYSRTSSKALTPTRELRDVREVSHRSPHYITSPHNGPPLRSPISPGHLSPRTTKQSRDFVEHDNKSVSSIGFGTKAGAIGLGGAAAAATAAALHHRNSGDQLKTPTRELSPMHSESSLHRDEVMEHPRVRNIRSGASLSSERKGRKSTSPVSTGSPRGSIDKGKGRPEGLSLERGFEILPEDEYSPETPKADELDQWLEREHETNDRYREEYDRESLLHSEPDHRRDTTYTEAYTEDSYLEESEIGQATRDVRFVGAKPHYVHTPAAVESAVASLQEPSVISVHSSNKSSPTKDAPGFQADSYALEEAGVDGDPQAKLFRDSRQRWEEIRDRAMAMTSGEGFQSPAQSETRSLDGKPLLGATYVPAGDMPEIGMYPDDESELITNPSIISGRMGDEHYEHHPDDEQNHQLRDAALIGAGAAAAGYGLGVASRNTPDAHKKEYQPSIEELEDEQLNSPRGFNAQQRSYNSPTQAKDEGYISANPAISPALHPVPQGSIDDYNLQFNDGLDEEDPFTTQKHLRHESGLSHGMASPLYDSATGKGIDRIQSKDIVALMDHLTVRDAQRNARDTEIMVTLVRSAAEMRTNFEDMKRYIAEQDRLLMHTMERGQEQTVQRVLGGPRPIPSSSPRTPRRGSSEDPEDSTTKRKNLFKRALKGLSLKSNNDLGKIEDMLMHLLSEVEGLKDGQTFNKSSQPATATSLNSYEHLRAATDPGYEPEGMAGTHSSPNQSGHLSTSSSRHLNGMHSGYDRRGSDGHRISTVLEEEEAEAAGLPSHYDVRDQDITPTRATFAYGDDLQTPPGQSRVQSLDPTPKTDKTRSKHKSSSSIFSGFPKISRWSKTTASTVPESNRNSRKERPYSQGSQSGSNLQLDYDQYDMNGDDQLRGTSFDDEITMGGGRPGSPLVPEWELDDPKYQAHRNSQNLQHPQPRPGPTHRHQNHLEDQAMSFENPPTPDADHWGSAPALALNRNRYSGGQQQTRLSPVQSDDGYSPSPSQQGPARPPKVLDDGPLVPPKIPFSSSDSNYSMYGVPMMNSGMHIASPLEPIEEVRKSLETDRSSIRHELTPSPRPTAMQTVQRKITGPREMPRPGTGGSSASRRKPVPSAPDSPMSYETYRTSLDSETF